MARQQKKGASPAKPFTRKPNNKKIQKKVFGTEANRLDVFEAEEVSGRRKGNDLDEVDNLEYDAGEIAEEDDSEIDSDEAFDDSDEEKFEGYKFSGSTKSAEKKHLKQAKKVVSGEIDLNEDEEEEDEEEDDASDFEGEEGEGFMDLSQMLGGGDEDDDSKPVQYDDDDDDDDEEEFRGFDNIEDSEDSDDDMDLNGDVSGIIDSLSKKRRHTEEEGPTSTKKRQLKERNEAYKESEFNLSTRDDDDSNKKLSFNDLMDTLNDETAFSSLKSSAETLAGKSKNSAKRALDAPLPKRIQDRMERQVALASATEEISKWEQTVQRNRQADHLQFPLQDPSAAPQESRTSAAMTSKFKAETSLEQQIAEALAQAGMKDEELEEFEALKLNKLTITEVEERRKELRMMRELMFRHEIKNKRLKKIKSKSYRKLQRKEKENIALQLKGMGEIDHEMDDDKMDSAMARAEERMSLKHKNTSKWAKRALARGNDDGTREAIMEQLRRGEELRKRIDGDESDGDSDQQGDEDDEEYISNQLNKFKEELDEDTPPAKGIMAMKFMQEASKRKLEATKQDALNFEKEWLAADSDDEKDGREGAGKTFTVVNNNPGRMAFGAKAKQLKLVNKEEEEENDQVGSVTVTTTTGQIKKVSNSAPHTTRTTTNVEVKKNKSPLADLDDTADSSNPWLQADTSRLAKKAAKKNNAISGQTESRAEHSISKINKTKKEKLAAQDTGDDVELDLTKIMTVKPAKKENVTKALLSKKQQSKQEQLAKVQLAKGDSESESEDASDDENDQIVHKNNVTFSQRELVARAFANDDVVTEFEAEKMAEIEEDGDKLEDLTLPGWGAWAGAGIKKNKKSKKIIKITKGIAAEDRRDAGKRNVIINEKVGKKAEKYNISAIPFPFKSMEQYERSIRTPVGSDWNTRQTFMKLTKPKVITKLGTVIDPLNAPFA